MAYAEWGEATIGTHATDPTPCEWIVRGKPRRFPWCGASPTFAIAGDDGDPDLHYCGAHAADLHKYIFTCDP